MPRATGTSHKVADRRQRAQGIRSTVTPMTTQAIPTPTIPARDEPRPNRSVAPASATSNPVPIHSEPDRRPTRWVVRVPCPTSSRPVPFTPFHRRREARAEGHYKGVGIAL